jgi:hypothetical protein
MVYILRNTLEKERSIFSRFCFLSASCWSLAWIIFDSENGGDIFFRNVNWLSTNFTAFYPKISSLHNHRCENPKFYTMEILYHLTIDIPLYVKNLNSAFCCKSAINKKKTKRSKKY